MMPRPRNHEPTTTPRVMNEECIVCTIEPVFPARWTPLIEFRRCRVIACRSSSTLCSFRWMPWIHGAAPASTRCGGLRNHFIYLSAKVWLNRLPLLRKRTIR